MDCHREPAAAGQGSALAPWPILWPTLTAHCQLLVAKCYIRSFMLNRVFITVTSAILLLSSSFSFAQAPANAQVTGSVAYRERMALPADAVIDVQLIDTSVEDIAAQTVAAAMINAEGRQVPVPFTLTYDPGKIEPAHRYSVRANIRSGDGMLMFSTTQAYPVVTHGAPSKVNLILHTVGHGAKPGSTTKKQSMPAASEATTSASPSAPPTPAESAPPVTSSTPSPNEPLPGAAAPSPPEPEKPAAQAESTPAQAESAAGSPSSTPSESPSAPPSPAAESAAAPTSQEPTPAEVAPAAEPSNPAPAPDNAPATAPAAPTQTEPAATEPAPAPASSSSASEPKPAPTPDEFVPPSPVDTVPEPLSGSIPNESAPPETPAARPDSKPTPAPPTASESATPPEGTTQPAAPTPEAKAAEPEAPLPEAPSASKRAELEAEAPGSAETNSTSRSEPSAPNKALTPLADTQWKLVQLGGQNIVITPPQKPVTLAFSPEGRRIAGSAGCNSYLGTFTDDHGLLELRPGNMTMMSCVDPAGSRERKFIAMLRSADGYKISGDVLLLTSDGKTVAKFKNNQ